MKSVESMKGMKTALTWRPPAAANTPRQTLLMP
jgi:hypothetical protein